MATRHHCGTLTNNLRSRMSPQISENEHVLQHPSAGNVTRAISPGTDSCAKYFFPTTTRAQLPIVFRTFPHEIRTPLLYSRVGFVPLLLISSISLQLLQNPNLYFSNNRSTLIVGLMSCAKKKKLATSDEPEPSNEHLILEELTYYFKNTVQHSNSWVILACMCVKLQMRLYVYHRVGPFGSILSILGPFWVSEW